MEEVFGSDAQERYRVNEASGIGAARRAAVRLAADAGLGETSVAQAGIVVTELATNLLNHAGGGEILLTREARPGGGALEVLAIDRGPGIGDVELCFEDGYSSRSSPGTGLGAVRRLAAQSDLYSVSGSGTVVFARLGSPAQHRIGAVCVAKDGESECGDAWRLAVGQGYHSLTVADGLGHGPLAARAAGSIVAACVANASRGPKAQLECAHAAASGTRGAAAACARWDATRRLSFGGIGNIAGRLLNHSSTEGLASHSGTLGLRMHRAREFDYLAEPGALLVMHSDGLSERWDLAKFPGLRSRHPAVIAATLYRDSSRGRDDTTVVVVRV